MFGRLGLARGLSKDSSTALRAVGPDSELSLQRLEVARLSAELDLARAEIDSIRRTISEQFGLNIEQSVNMSELICLMAWSNGNVRKLSGEAVSISSAVEEMALTVRNIAELSASALDQVGEARHLVETGVSRSDSAGRAMEEISEAFRGLDGRMNALGRAIETIGGFAKEIESISSQTKLLALNATIEAARAGEAGRGFAVVAAEVKGLSEETSKTTDLIRGQLGALTDVMNGMLSAMQIGGAKVIDGQATFREVVNDMHGISAHISEVNSGVSSITGMLKDQHIATDSIARNITEIARLASQNETDTNASSGFIKKSAEMIARIIDGAADSIDKGYGERRLRGDLMAWKTQLAECLVGIVSLDPQIYARECKPLGVWFTRIETPATLANPDFIALKPIAEQMSREAAKLVQEVKAGAMDKAIGAYMTIDDLVKQASTRLEAIERGLKIC